jgi:hypothetical protein
LEEKFEDILETREYYSTLLLPCSNVISATHNDVLVVPSHGVVNNSRSLRQPNGLISLPSPACRPRRPLTPAGAFSRPSNRPAAELASGKTRPAAALQTD